MKKKKRRHLAELPVPHAHMKKQIEEYLTSIFTGGPSKDKPRGNFNQTTTNSWKKTLDSSFLSGSPRQGLFSIIETPGPGHYNFPLKDQSNLVNFGSYSKRDTEEFTYRDSPFLH